MLAYEPASNAPACQAPDFSPRKPALTFPANACDCHAHILGPVAQFAYAAERIYTPPDCLLSDYQAMLQALGVQRAVLIQPSVYGTDNTVMLQALQKGGDNVRGVAVVPWDIDPASLQTMHQAGVRGVRVNIVDVQAGKSGFALEQLHALALRIAPLGWHMEFLMHVDAFPNLDTLLAGFPVDVVLGHLGYMRTELGLGHPGFAALLRLLKAGRAWVKLTGPYRISSAAWPYADTTVFARALLGAAPNRVLWGSDWPHVMLKGHMPNDADLADLLADWIPDSGVRHRVLVDNPAALYGF